MMVDRTLDAGLIIDILMDDDIFDAISEDGGTHEDLKVDVFKDHWLHIIDNKEGNSNWPIMGCVQFKKIFKNTYDCHVHILPKYRKEFSLEVGDKILEWCEKHLPGVQLITNVPVICKNVKLWLEAFGFVETGILEKAWTKSGQLNDMWILSRGISCQ